jgi:hypothetical protein
MPIDPPTNELRLPKYDVTARAQFWLIVLLPMIVLTPVISARSADPSYLLAQSGDEYSSLTRTQEIQAMLVEGELWQIVSEPLRWGYGLIYQLVYAIVTLPWYLMDSFTGQLIAGRMLGLLFTGLAMGYAYRINLLISGSRGISFVLACCLLTMNGLFVEHKFYAPDQFANFLFVASMFHLCRDRASLGRDYIWATILFGLAVAQKISLSCAGPALAAAVILAWLRHGRLLWAARQAMLGMAIIAVVFVISNISIFLSWENLYDYRYWIQHGLDSMSTAHFGRHNKSDSVWDRVAEWLWNDKNSVSTRFFGPFTQLTLLGFFGAALFLSFRDSQRKDIRLFLTVLSCAFLSVILQNALSTDRVWYWHIAPVFFLSLCGVASLLATLPPASRRWKTRIAAATAVMLLVDNAEPWWRFQHARLTEHQTADFIRQRKEMLQVREKVCELLDAAGKNPENCDLMATKLGMDNPYWYSDQGIAIRIDDALDLIKFVKKEFPAVLVLNLEFRRYQAMREKIMSNYLSRFKKPSQSKTSKQWYQYELVESISNKHIFKRVPVDAAVAMRIRQDLIEKRTVDPEVAPASFELSPE